MDCFRRWQSLGFRVRTANVAREAEMLRAVGLEDGDILSLDEGDAGRNLFGKPVPRIQAVIARMVDLAPDVLILVNSDIFPAVRTPRFLSTYLAQAPLLALTREETPTLAAFRSSQSRPYRGGLDAFVMTHSGLRRMGRALAGFPVAARMAFGIPGWDFLMGAVIQAEGGAILDSGLLLHESHTTTYSNVDEFGHYLEAMRALGATTGSTAAEAALQFAQHIDRSCRSMRHVTAMARLAHLSLPLPPRPSTTALARARSILATWSPTAAGANLHSVAALADEIASSVGSEFERALNLLRSGGGRHVAFGETLLAVLLHLRCREGQALVGDVAGDRRHIKELRAILLRRFDDHADQRLAVAEVFGRELADHGVFNATLFDYLVLSAQNDGERALLAEVQGEVRKKVMPDA